MSAKSHPMVAFMKNTISLKDIYDLLKKDFASQGKKNISPDTTFYDNPPAGMGYDAFSIQSFLNAYVNSEKGKGRYNLAPDTNIFITQVAKPKCVGNLAALIFAKQV
jgi:hypothetical protein